MDNANKNKKRMFHLLMVVLIGWSMLVYRLISLQITDTRDFSKYHIDLLAKSVQQRSQEFVLSSGRGNILDHNLQSLLGQEGLDTVIIFPFMKNKKNSQQLKSLADILEIEYKELDQQINGLLQPSYIVKNDQPIRISSTQKELINKLKIPGIFAVNYTVQNNNVALAKHVIGFLGQAPEEIKRDYQKYVERGTLKPDSSIGRSGLQKTFQELLMGVGETKIAYFVDNRGYPLNGLGSNYQQPEDAFYPLSLVTTIDKDIQSYAESQLKNNQIKEGSIVVLDVKNGDILAMANAPDFNLTEVNPNTPDWNNKAIQIIEPGSIFKTVIAIAGLSEGVVTTDEKFYCTGDYDAYNFKCNISHGEITFAEGYAESCNIVFAEVAKRLGADKIEKYAEELGLTGTIGWKGKFFNNELFTQFDNEETNRVFHAETIKNDTGQLIRTAIGQQDVRISPLAAANLIVTILNSGQVHEPRIVEKVIYKNNIDYFQFPVHKREANVGNKMVYSIIEEMMEMVVSEGTGQMLKQAKWQLAGKSGTAETLNGLNHQWFIGYGPTEQPKYAIAVVVKNVSTIEPMAKKTFMGIMDDLATKQNTER